MADHGNRDRRCARRSVPLRPAQRRLYVAAAPSEPPGADAQSAASFACGMPIIKSSQRSAISRQDAADGCLTADR